MVASTSWPVNGWPVTAAAVARVLPLRGLQDLGHDRGDLLAQGGAGVGQLLRCHRDLTGVGHLEDDLMADLGVEVARHEGAVGRGMVPRVLPLARARDGGSCWLPPEER